MQLRGSFFDSGSMSSASPKSIKFIASNLVLTLNNSLFYTLFQGWGKGFSKLLEIISSTLEMLMFKNNFNLLTNSLGSNPPPPPPPSTNCCVPSSLAWAARRGKYQGNTLRAASIGGPLFLLGELYVSDHSVLGLGLSERSLGFFRALGELCKHRGGVRPSAFGSQKLSWSRPFCRDLDSTGFLPVDKSVENFTVFPKK